MAPYLYNPAQVTITQPAKRVLGGIVPQAAFPDGPMKAATRVPASDASPLFYTASNVLRVSHAHGHDTNAIKLADSWRTYQSQFDPHIPSRAIRSISCQTG
jgi:hypothetical protein